MHFGFSNSSFWAIALTLTFVAMATVKASVFQQRCGLRQSRQGKVVGGFQSSPGQYPWIVSVRLQVSSTVAPQHFCGGAIIGNRWILTAAHCVARYQASSFTVRAGSFFRARNDDPNLVDYAVSRVIMHPSYTYPNYYNDIAILKLATPILYRSSNIQPICIPAAKKEYVGVQATVAGWGWLGEDRNPIRQPDQLHQVTVPVKDHATCQNFYSSRKITLLRSQMCAGFKEGGRDSCQGDSGGPLIASEGGRYYVIGVVSAGIGCARPQLPGLYTKVSHFRTWILNTIDS